MYRFLWLVGLVLLAVVLLRAQAHADDLDYHTYLPAVERHASPTPTATETATATPTETATSTVTSTPPPTLTPTWTPTWTPTPTNMPTATSTPSPLLQVGQVIKFKGWEHKTRLQGTVTGSENRASLSFWLGTYPATGVYLIVFLDVYNAGLEPDEVGIFSYSFRVRDSAGRTFSMTDVYPQMAANDTYNLPGVYETIQPGFTLRMVFVFDVLPESRGVYLVSLAPW